MVADSAVEGPGQPLLWNAARGGGAVNRGREPLQREYLHAAALDCQPAWVTRG